jgi:hypothetical protein
MIRLGLRFVSTTDPAALIPAELVFDVISGMSNAQLPNQSNTRLLLTTSFLALLAYRLRSQQRLLVVWAIPGGAFGAKRLRQDALHHSRVGSEIH